MSKSKSGSNKQSKASKPLKGNNKKFSASTKHAADNRANQLNPNNSAYKKSRVSKNDKYVGKK